MAHRLLRLPAAGAVSRKPVRRSEQVKLFAKKGTLYRCFVHEADYAVEVVGGLGAAELFAGVPGGSAI